MKSENLKLIQSHLNSVILGKEKEILLALSCLLSRGHLLIEDIPGVGKTTLVQVIARLLGFKLSRIQCTNDLLPADIIGTNIFNKDNGSFEFRPGPLVNEFVLADELNRATPKAQSALLQAMEERSISHDQGSIKLPDTFMLIATQNPFEQVGTHLLPESQLDRFRMSLYLDLPSREVEKKILLLSDRDRSFLEIEPVLTPTDFLEYQKEADQILVSDAIVDYVLDVLEHTRNLNENFIISSRAGRDLLCVAKAYAYLDNRTYVLPEDIQETAPYVWGHRVAGHKGVKYGVNSIKNIIKNVKIS